MNETLKTNDPEIEAEVERYAAMPYRRELLRNTDGTWFARVVELAGCMTEGDTEVEALSNLNDAMRLWIGTQLDDGDSIPSPNSYIATAESS